MRSYRVLIMAGFLLVAAALGEAQTAPPQAATKVAVFDSEALGDKKAGVKRLLTAYEKIETDLKPRRDEIVGLRTKYDALLKTINDTQAVADPNVIRQKRDEADNLAREIQRKQEDGQKELERLTKIQTEPIFASIGTSLESFAKQRGFDIVLDLSKFAGAVMILNQSIDITAAFINDYNTKNPVVPAGVPAKQP